MSILREKACFQVGTKVLESTGRIKKVEEFKVGDKLMGTSHAPHTLFVRLLADLS